MWAKENKAKVIAVTNSPISALGQIGDIVLLADSAGIGPASGYMPSTVAGSAPVSTTPAQWSVTPGRRSG
jgi:DNA-binding MurR/RpiR family transcriptional regulator